MENQIVMKATSVVSKHYSLTELSPKDVMSPVSPRKRSRESEEASEKDLLAQVNLHSCYQYDFDRIRVVFGNLIETVAPLIEASIPSLKNLQKYLQRCFQELQPQLAKAESFDDVMDIIQDKCTVINVCCLDAIVDHYNIVEAKLPIADFKATVDKFCEKVKDEICCNQSFMMASSSKYVTYETIVFFLEWEVDKYTLKEIRSLLSKAFKDVAKRVVVRTIKDNSTITLLVITKENFHLLKEMGLSKETIGNQTTFDEDKRDHLKETQWDAEDFQDKFKSGNLLIKETLTDWLRRNEAVDIIKMVSCEEQQIFEHISLEKAEDTLSKSYQSPH